MYLSQPYPLQDGYYLQRNGSGYGYLSKGYLMPVVTEPILGIQGSTKGYIYGWTNPKPNQSKYFIVNTKTSKVEWLSYNELNEKCKDLAIGKPDMNKEINLAGLSLKTGVYYQSKDLTKR